jgi:transcriptional regulator with XRE-family HTH domain
MRFADKLKELRAGAGLSQPALAKKAGLPLGSIRQYEQGRREPYWQVVFKLADALGVEPSAFKDCVDHEPTVNAKAKNAAKAKKKK